MEENGCEIAIVGMSCRFPGANGIEEFWSNLSKGTESITHFTTEQLRTFGVSEDDLNDRNYVRSSGVLENIEGFDADFFGFTLREAQLMDPQARLFLECAWEAMERAGYDSEKFAGKIGVFAGSSRNSYLNDVIHRRPEIVASVGAYQIHILNGNDFLATQTAYKLNFSGPCMTIQTACSTSLVSVHVACQSLLGGECDMALAGASSIRLPHRVGYSYVPGHIMSPDGHCRAFDKHAMGTVGGSGAGIVVLKRLGDAIENGDRIHAVIKGSAVNNDGGDRMSFSAPRADGQAEVIRSALHVSGVDADTVQYVEAHGTATTLGDPIEIAGLTRAFRYTTERKEFCAIGSVKTNIGHVDAAAGVAGLIKTVLSIEHGEIPPSLHFTAPNDQIDFSNSPFFVNTERTAWPTGSTPRRAGVSSFGMGGTNAHVVLEQAPSFEPRSIDREYAILPLSARTPIALDTMHSNLSAWFSGDGEKSSIPDVAYTLQTGRKEFEHRFAFVCDTPKAAQSALETGTPNQSFLNQIASQPRTLAFMFPGQGSQYVNMARDLYLSEPIFKAELDHCFELARKHMPLDLKSLIYTEIDQLDAAAEQLNQTEYAQPAIFCIAYSVAKLFQEMGVVPQAYIGHSLGEFVAAALAGIMKLDDAIRMVVTRGQLMQACMPGKMLTIPLSEAEVRDRLGAKLSIAAYNTNESCIASGPEQAIRALSTQLKIEGIPSRILHTSHAFHSPMMEPAAKAFEDVLRSIHLAPPRRRIISNVSGTWLKDEEATDPGYWASQMLAPVRFSDGSQTLLTAEFNAFLEIGPGEALSSFLRLQSASDQDIFVQSSLRHPDHQEDDRAFLLRGIANSWVAGVDVDWIGFHRNKKRRRVLLPTYPFMHIPCWLDAPKEKSETQKSISGFVHASIVGSSELNISDTATSENLTEPESDLHIIQGIWSDLFGFKVGLDDHFYDLGGTSLLATSLVARLRQVLGVDLPLRILFESPTVAELTVAVAEERRKDANLIPDIRPLEHNGPISTSFAQERLWLLEQIEPAGSAYNIPMVIELHEDIDTAAIEKALDELVARHQPLRTAFRSNNGQAEQTITPHQKAELSFVDLTGRPQDQIQSTLNEQLAETAWTPFDLSNSSMLRAKLIRVTAAEYRLVVVLHHIATDAWSMGILRNEFQKLYDAYCQGKDSPLEPLPVTYADFSVWQRSLFEDGHLDSQIEYWKNHLRDLPNLNLPTDRRRPAAQSYEGAGYQFRISEETARILRKLAVEERSTLYMTFLAAFKVLLARISGQTDIVVGVPIAGRQNASLEGLVGFFINTLVMRTDLAKNPSFREVLGRVRKTAIDAYNNQDVPFEKLVEVLSPSRDVRRPPLFQVMLDSLDFDALDAEDNSDGTGPEAIHLSEENRVLLDRYAKFDLIIYMQQKGDEIICNLKYSVDLFDVKTIEMIFGNFVDLIDVMVRAPDKPVFEIELSDWPTQPSINATAPASTTVLDNFTTVAERYPHSLAVSGADSDITYEDLVRQSNLWTASVKNCNISSGDHVIVLSGHTPAMVPAVLGVMRAGSIPALLDISQESSRLLDCVRRVDAKAIIFTSQHSARLATLISDTMGIPTLKVDLNGDLLGAPPVSVKASDTAYIVFTSGSSGTPNAVYTSHAALARAINWQIAQFEITHVDRVSLLSGLDHDPVFRDIFIPLSIGGSLIIPNSETRKSGRLAEWMEQNSVSVAHLTPGLSEIITTSECKLPDLRLGFIGADRMLPAEIESLERTCINARLFSVYGATETPQFVAYAELKAGRTSQYPLIGQAAEDVELLILTDQRTLCAPSEVGELAVQGRIAEGYVGDETLTTKKFVHLPDTDGTRTYLTGDLVRRRADGLIEFLGRRDGQINIRGFRVEVIEIENALLNHSAVAQVVVDIALKDADDLNVLVAYVVPVAGQTPYPTQLRQHLSVLLPEFMIPQHHVIIEQMPLRPNGKINMAALRAIEITPQVVTHLATTSPTEEMLAGIWADVLGLTEVSGGANFFDLGGHSLKAVQITNRIAGAFGVTISVRVLFEQPTIAQLARQIDVNLRGETRSPPLISLPSNDEPHLLSFAQERLWFHSQMDPGNAAYHLPITFRLRGDLVQDFLVLALTALTERHFELRTRFVMIEGRGRKIVDEASPVEPLFIDLSQHGADAEQALDSWLTKEWTRPFDLSREGPFRVALAKTGPDEHVLVLTTHHIISDAWSQGLILRDLVTLYNALCSGEPPSLTPLPIQYSDYAAWEASKLSGRNYNKLENYWTLHLDGAPHMLALPFDAPPSEVNGSDGSDFRFHIDQELSDAIADLARSENATPFMILMSAFKLLLYRHTGQTDSVVGAHFANRQATPLESIVGFFANSLPLRTNLSGGQSFRELLKTVCEATVGAYVHQEMPFAKLVEVINPPRDLIRPPLIQALLSFQNNVRQDVEFSDLQAQPIPSIPTSSAYELSFIMQQLENGLSGQICYRSNLFTSQTIEQLAADFISILKKVVSDAGTKVSDIAIIGTTEMSTIATTLKSSGHSLETLNKGLAGADVQLFRRYKLLSSQQMLDLKEHLDDG